MQCYLKCLLWLEVHRLLSNISMKLGETVVVSAFLRNSSITIGTHVLLAPRCYLIEVHFRLCTASCALAVR